MNTGNDDASCPKLVDEFSLGEKVLMQGGLYGAIAVGGYGIYRAEPLWAWVYLVFSVIGFLGPVVGFLCARCPYPYARKTCLFAPYRVVPLLYAHKSAPLRLWQKVVLIAFFAAVLLIPLPWLWAQPPLLALFLILAVPTYGAVLLHYCPRCRNRACPFNRAPSPAA